MHVQVTTMEQKLYNKPHTTSLFCNRGGQCSLALTNSYDLAVMAGLQQLDTAACSSAAEALEDMKPS